MKDKYRVIYQPRGAALEYSPLALNLYDGCENGCDYCYVPGVLHRSKDDFHRQAAPRKENMLELVKADLEEMTAAGDKRPVLLCFTCDPYPQRSSMTRLVLQLFQAYRQPFQILTKGGLRAVRDFDLYSEGDTYAATLTFINESDSIRHEPKAATPWDRIGSLHHAKRAGITTWVSFEPVLDSWQVYQLYQATRDYVDLFKIGKLNHQASDIDWRAFALQMIELCERDRKNYLIKDALAAYLKEGDHHD